ncbi:response regulator transcription factor [Clostridium sp. DL1XJH146]
MRILLVEDERSLSDIVMELLKKDKYIVDAVYDGEDGLEYGLSGIYDLIILDIMLPKMNGIEVLKNLRKQEISTPIIMLTAISEVEDKVMGLDCGADDYITKPFQTIELMARIRSATRRKGIFTGDVLTFADLSVEKECLKASTDEGEVKLSLKEYQILEILMENPKQIITKDKIVEKIWGYNYEGEYNSVEVYISFVRKKLKFIRSNVKIKASRGLGYSLEDQL